MEKMFFYFDLCAIVVCVILIVALISRKLTKGRSNILFMMLVVAVFLTAFFDIIATSLDYSTEVTKYATPIRYLLNTLYFMFRSITVPLYIMYVCSHMGISYLFYEDRVFRRILAIPVFLASVIILSNPFTHLVFSIGDDLKYYRGPLTFALYFIGFYFVVVAFVIIHKNYQLLTKGKMIVLQMFLPINVVSVVLQMIWSDVRFELFITTLLLIAMAITVQRPEDLVDYIVNANSYSAFISDVKKSYIAKTPMVFMFVKFTNYYVLRRSIGHDYYSKLLRNISDKMYRISKIMKVHGEIYYLDNGSFAVMTSMREYEQLLDMGRIIAAYLQEPMKMEHLEVMLDARVCVATTPEDIDNEAALLLFAKNFQNKVPEERRLILLSSLMSSRDFRLRNDIDAIINRGIQTKNFEMYYQPIYSIKKKKYVSAEALIRLKDPKYGFVSPALFIPAAEESGAIHQIGDYVLEEVFSFIASTDFRELGLEYIEINLSVAQCIEANLFEKIDGLMKKYNVRPDQVNLEITETSVDYDPATTDKNINKLHEAGITFSLDDYGTGYSNITRVVSLPLDIVKLDKTLVDEMDTTVMSTVINNTVSMLKRMNKKILVEGVEEFRQYQRFEDLECDYIQGYFFSKPLPRDEYIKFVKERNID